MTVINRFIDSTLSAFIPRTYTAEQVVKKLETEIQTLHSWLLSNEPGSDTWKEKRELMLNKIENLDKIKEETLNQK